jgi:hypothetical protein
MKKVLDHLIRRNGLGHVALTFSGGVDLEPGEAWALWDPALHRILRKQNSVLRRLGVQELDWAPRCASDPWLTSATVVLVADTAVEAVIRRRFATLISNDAGGRDKIVLFAALDPHRYREAHDLPDPDQSRITVRASAFNILTVMTERILPILFQRAGSLDAALPWRLRALEPPSSLAEHRSVANFRKVVGALEGQLRDSKSPEVLDRLLKLVWALAYRDASMLLLSGLPDALREQARVSTDLDDATLWNCLRNLAWLDSVIPGNRAKDYARIARLLGKAGAATRPTSAGDDPESTAMS